jgi:hypothetical protein
VTFLLDLASAEQRIVGGKVAYRPDPNLRVGTSAFVWKVICDLEGKVVVYAATVNGRGKTEVIATARWSDGELADYRQQTSLLPTGYQWNLVEDALRVALDGAPGAPLDDPQLVEDVSAIEARFEARERDWLPRLDGAARPPRRRRGLYVAAALGAASVAVVVVVGASRCARTPAVTPPVATASADPPPAPVPDPVSPVSLIEPPAPVPAHAASAASPAERIANAGSLAEALAIARPELTDTPEELGTGTRLLASFAARRLRWADVDVAAETTIGRVEKDPEPERGKRLCATGELLQIERRDLDARKIYVGRLRTRDDDTLAFVAVGSTGDLVKRSTGKLCGVVTGKAGGAVAVVGMFELPENRRPTVEQ